MKLSLARFRVVLGFPKLKVNIQQRLASTKEQVLVSVFFESALNRQSGKNILLNFRQDSQVTVGARLENPAATEGIITGTCVCHVEFTMVDWTTRVGFISILCLPGTLDYHMSPDARRVHSSFARKTISAEALK